MTEHSIKAEDDTGADPSSSMINSSSCNIPSPMLGSGRKRKQDLQYPGNGSFTTSDSWPTTTTTTTSVDGNNPTTSFEYPPISSWSSSSSNTQQYKHSSLLHDDHPHDTPLIVDEHHHQGKSYKNVGNMSVYAGDVTLHDI